MTRYTNSPIANWKGGTLQPFVQYEYLLSDVGRPYSGRGEGEDRRVEGGRLAEYKYYDMAPVVEKVMGRFNK